MNEPRPQQVKEPTEEPSRADLLHMAGEIVAAYVGHNPLPQDKVAGLITTVFNTLTALGEGSSTAQTKDPAVPIGKSVTPDYLICLEDGKKLKMLKRYLRSAHGLTPEDYRAKWNLPADYPMVAPNYAKRRSEFAKQSGLGKGAGKKGR